MTGMIDPDEVVHPGGTRRSELAGMEVALVRRHRCKRVAHIADPRLVEIDQFNPWNRCENLDRAFCDSGYAWVLVQCNSLLDRIDEVRPELVNACRNVRDDMFEIERSVRARHHDFAQLDVTGRTPREHTRSTRAGKSGDGVSTHLSRGFGVARAVLNHAATVSRAGKNFIASAEAIQHFEAQKRDVRRLEHVAP